MKAACRQLERLSRKTGLTVHALAYKDHVSTYKEALNHAKNTYYSSIIAQGQGNPRTLIRTINNLLQPAKQFPLAASTKLCCDFMDFFNNKTTNIYQQLYQTTSQLNAFTTLSPFPFSCL